MVADSSAGTGDSEDEDVVKQSASVVLADSMMELERPGEVKKKRWEAKAVARSAGSGSGPRLGNGFCGVTVLRSWLKSLIRVDDVAGGDGWL